MAADSHKSGPDEVRQIATLMLRRFEEHPSRWHPGEPLDPEVRPWEALYTEIEAIRADATAEGLRGLAVTIRRLRILDRDRHGRFVHPEAVSFQKTACHAIAELHLTDSRSPEDVEVAEALISICPTAEWEMAYFDTLGELFDDEGDLDLAGELLEKAYRGAQDAGEPREILRSLRHIRRLVDRSGNEDTIPEWTGPLPDLLTSVHVAAALGISLRTARGKMTDGSIPSTKFGRQRYTRKEEFLALFRPDRR